MNQLLQTLRAADDQPCFRSLIINSNCSYQPSTILHVNNHDPKVLLCTKYSFKLRLQECRSNFPEQQTSSILELWSFYSN